MYDITGTVKAAQRLEPKSIVNIFGGLFNLVCLVHLDNIDNLVNLQVQHRQHGT